MEIIPLQVQRSWLVLSRAGASPIVTVGAPGIQGAGVTGRQGMGVSTPIAAVVAAATAGLAGQQHRAGATLMCTFGLAPSELVVLPFIEWLRQRRRLSAGESVSVSAGGLIFGKHLAAGVCVRSLSACDP